MTDVGSDDMYIIPLLFRLTSISNEMLQLIAVEAASFGNALGSIAQRVLYSDAAVGMHCVRTGASCARTNHTL
jgi:hypothetical protein